MGCCLWNLPVYHILLFVRYVYWRMSLLYVYVDVNPCITEYSNPKHSGPYFYSAFFRCIPRKTSSSCLSQLGISVEGVSSLPVRCFRKVGKLLSEMLIKP